MSIARVALFAAIVQTVVANNGTYVAVSTCTQDADCRQFDDLSATCIAGACECSNWDSTHYCLGDSSPQGYEPVHFVLSFDFPCDAFFGSDILASYTYYAARAVAMSWDVRVQDGEFNVTFSCGSTNAIVSGMVQIGQVAFIAEKLSSGVDTTLVGTEMEGSLTAVSATLEHASICGGRPHEGQTIYLSGTCVPVSCASEYTLTLNRTEEAPRPRCVKSSSSSPSPSDSDDSDDDLSDGAIAGIVVGSVMGAVLIIAVVVLLVGSKKTPTQENVNENEPTVQTV